MAVSHRVEPMVRRWNMKISGLTFLGNSPELDAEFKSMVSDLKLGTRIDGSLLSNQAMDENIVDQGE